MAPSYNVGDSFLVNRAAYIFSSPKRGDVVQLMLPGKNVPLIKRVLGLPGETVEFRENRVLINGQILPEDGYTIAFTAQGQGRNHAPVTLGAHELYLVGDNRDWSIDSRTWGPIAEDRVLGKVIVTYARSK